MQVAKVEAEKAVLAPVSPATDIAENVPLPARRPIELGAPRTGVLNLTRGLSERERDCHETGNLKHQLKRIHRKSPYNNHDDMTIEPPFQVVCAVAHIVSKTRVD
jgi:hypothetical protein